MIFALFLAFLLNKEHKGAGIFQALFYFPSVAAGTAVYMVWIWLFNSETGVFNYLLSLIGIEGPRWLYQYGMGNAVVDYYESDILWSGNVDFFGLV